MAEINNSLAAQINANPIDLRQTFGTLSQIELAQAHKGLYNIQALQQQRQYNALQAASEAYKQGKDPVAGYLSAGGDPAGGQTLQTIFAGQRAMGATPGGLMPQHYQELTGAGKNVAETRKIGVDTAKDATELVGRLAQGVLVDPTNDSAWANAVNSHYNNFGGPSLERQQLLAVTDPNKRRQIAAAYSGQGIQPGTFNAPHNVEPTARVTTPGAVLNQNVPPPQARAAVPSSPAIVGDDEAVRSGLYEPTPEQKARGVVATPNANVAQRFGTIPAAMTPAQVKETQEYGEHLGKLPGVLADKADASRNMNFTLDQMRNETATWRMGAGGEALMKAQQYLKPIANGFGSTAFDKPVADFEAFQKNSGTLVRQAVKEVSSRAAVQEFQMIQNQLPSADMSRQGFNQIVDQFQAVNDFNISKQQAAEAYRQRRGSLSGFESEWNKNITPAAFLVSRMSPQDLGALRARLEMTPEGRTTLKSITQQMQWARDNNLDGAVR